MARDRAGNSARKARDITLRRGRSVFRDQVDRSDKFDFYRFKLGSSSRLKVSLSKLTDNADVAILDRRRKTVGTSRRPGRRTEKINATLNPGTYFIRVSRRQGSARYRLKLVSRAASGARSAAPATSAPPQPFEPAVELTPAVTSAPSSSNPLIRGVLNLTNAVRRQANLAPLQFNGTLSAVAQGHSQNMAINDFFSHTDPNGNRSHQRVAAVNYGYRAAAENIGAGYSTAQGVVDAWMASPSHRANILNPLLTEIGVGHYFLADDPGSVTHNHYWTQVFAAPLR